MIRALTITLTALSIVGFSALPVLAEDGLSPDSAAPASESAALTMESIEAADKKLIADADGDAKTDASADSKDKDSKDKDSKAGDAKAKKEKKEPKAKKEKAPKDPVAKDPAGAKPAKSAKGGSDVNIATRLAAFTVGVVVGTPIAIVRRTGMEIVQGEHDLVGDPDTWYRKAAYVMPGFISVPYGSISGGIGGCLYAVKNAWQGSGDEPFGKDSFSLGDVGN